MRNDEDLDQVLDRALESYCNVEPRAGIEARVLHRVRFARSMRWVWLIPVIAVALFVALMFKNQPKPSIARPSVIARSSDVPQPEVSRVIISGPKPRKRTPRWKLPRQDQFPSPSPLTSEDRAMVLLAAANPKQAEALTGQSEIEPIKITDLQITPLPSDGE